MIVIYIITLYIDFKFIVHKYIIVYKIDIEEAYVKFVHKSYFILKNTMMAWESWFIPSWYKFTN